MPYLSVAKIGYASKFDLLEIVNAILYKLKSGCQWRFLPLGHLFSGEPPSWNTVFQHYRKWCVKTAFSATLTRTLKGTTSAILTSLAHCHQPNTGKYQYDGNTF